MHSRTGTPNVNKTSVRLFYVFFQDGGGRKRTTRSIPLVEYAAIIGRTLPHVYMTTAQLLSHHGKVRASLAPVSVNLFTVQNRLRRPSNQRCFLAAETPPVSTKHIHPLFRDNNNSNNNNIRMMFIAQMHRKNSLGSLE